MMRVLAVTLLLLSASPVLAQEQCGDADGSGTVNVTDGVQTLRAAAGLPTSCTAARCDVNDDGAISVTDGVNVLRAAAGLSVSLTCPGTVPGCVTATVTVTLAVPEPIGAGVLTLAYPASSVTLPGSGDAAAERVTILTAAQLLNDGSPNDRDDRLTFGLVAFDGVGAGALLAVRFDCLGPAPGSAAFDCTLTDVTATDGVTGITGATCTVGVASE